MSNSHSHDHGHHHHHHHHHHHCGHTDGADHQRVLKGLRLAFFLNISFAIFELIGGYLTNSVAVMSDALHDLGDALALGMAWWFEKKSVEKANLEYTYGYRRLSLLSSLATGGLLLIGSFFIISESIERLFDPEPVIAWGMVLMAFVGIGVNGWSLLQFSKTGGANERMIRLHLIEDVAGWVILLFTGIILSFVNWFWLDAAVGAGLAVWIIVNVIRQLRAVFEILLQGIPKGLSIEAIESSIKTTPLVKDCHHTHVWTLDGEKHILTTHVQVQASVTPKELMDLKSKIKSDLRQKYSIFEATIEFETESEICETPTHA